MDDDGDDLVDGQDLECSGALDDDEGSFGTGVPGDNRDPFWQDCFFDGNSGAGDDKCRYHTECITGEREQSDSGCQVSAECQEKCSALVPNGCDCFGCCTITTPVDGDVNVILGSTCSLATIGDTTACPRCNKTDQCENPCGTCELCPGKTVLPPECDKPECEGGAQVCDTTTPCVAGYYCSLGCCILEDIVR
jgi:hypothetical protein